MTLIIFFAFGAVVTGKYIPVCGHQLIQRAVTILIHIIYTMLFPINEESNLGFVHFSTLVLLN